MEGLMQFTNSWSWEGYVNTPEWAGEEKKGRTEIQRPTLYTTQQSETNSPMSPFTDLCDSKIHIKLPHHWMKVKDLTKVSQPQPFRAS
jgi:hypothetical protein